MNSGGLILGYIVGQISSTGRLLWRTWKEEGKQIISYISINEMKRNIIKYKNFPLYSLWSGLLNTASVMMPPLLLSYFYTPAVVGYYALGQRVVNLPMNLIGNAVAQAFYPYASEANGKGNLSSVTFVVFKNLISIGLVPILLISLIAPELFVFIFGENWYEAGQYVRWISLWLFVVFIASPLSNLYSVLEMQRIGLFIDFLLFLSRLTVLIIGGLYGNALFTIALFGIVGALIWMVNCIVILKLVGLSFFTIIKEISFELLKAIPFTILTVLSLVILDNSLILILSAILSGLVFLILKIKNFTMLTSITSK
ncbi:oligosaccharide flippase family protein [Cytobacillus solani]|uniref:oligosaccharide flippase family protein n=1 Tax=Cytobacillus solani TaxID=1637975 RepID=UPI0011548F88|nr:oligosaccharide flippase family protein [Cytobacillus solani]